MNKIFSIDSKFARFMNALGDVMLIGILWIICSLPLVTIVASTAAAYYAMAKCVRGKCGHVIRSFFHSFKTNFLQALIPSVLILLSVFAIVFDMKYLWDHRSPANDAGFIALILTAFVIGGFFFYFPAFLSRFEKNTAGLVKMTLFSVFRFLPVTAIIIIVFTLGILGVYLMPWAVIIIPGGFLFALTFPMEMVLRKFMPKPDEGSSEADRWFYGS